MSNFDWLSNPNNQRVLYALSSQALQETAPEELPLFQELFPQYVTLAGPDLEGAGTEDSAFSFSGDEELLTLIILPALAATLSALLVKKGTKRLSDLQEAEQDEATSSQREQVIAELNEQMPQNIPSGTSRQRLLTLLATILLEFIANH